MRQLLRNRTAVWYCLYEGKTASVDEYGNLTGEFTITYSDPKEIKLNVGSAKGTSAEEMFGTDISYDHILTMSRDVFDRTGIDEHTVFGIGIPSAVGEDGLPNYNYRVMRISSTLNETAIAVEKVR